MKIAVTGGSGFIGKKLVAALVGMGDQINLLTRRSYNQNTGSSVRFVSGDLCSPQSNLSQFLTDCDVIYHCAGELRNPSVMRDLHVGGTARLLDAIEEVSRSRDTPIHWVQLSSVGAYGPPKGAASTSRVLSECAALRPAGVYETTKVESDLLVAQAAGAGLITQSTLRPSIVIGSEMSNQSVRALARMISKRYFFYVGPTDVVSTYVHVDDVVRAMIACAVDSRARGQTFNISNDCYLSEIVQAVAARAQVPITRLRVPEGFIRPVVEIASRFFPLPLSQKRIDALVARTRYPSTKLFHELDFVFTRSIPEAVADLL